MSEQQFTPEYSPTVEGAGAEASGRTEREHRPPGAEATALRPGSVIPGESSENQLPESGERYEIIARGNRACLVAHPLPHPLVAGYTAITDYLNCTFPFKVSPDSLRVFMHDFAQVAGPKFTPMKECGRGFNGYERSFDLGAFGAKFACVGQAGTAMLSLPGQACAVIQDWQALIIFLRDGYGARITRWDGAVDDFDGSHSIDWAVDLYKSGGFTNGGNKPSCRQAGNWIEPDGTGRTFYIGKRENGKMLRIYEKGMQCIHEWHPWVRYEVELHNVDRVIPWDVLLNPGQYVAGAYPKALGWVTEEMSRIRTLQEEGTLSYEHLVHCASNAYGPLVNVMLQVEGSPEKVVERLRKPGKPARLNFSIDEPWWN